MSMSNINPINPPAPYLGGKRLLAKTIIPLITQIEHRTYAEPFIGMGGIFFRRPRKPKAEVINDYNKEVATLFRILQRHYPQFIDTIKFQITGRTEFERLVNTSPDTLTDLERSARFLYLQRNAFGGKITGQHFGVDVTRSARFDITKLTPLLEDVHERLSSVVIECLPYDLFIKRYDKTSTLFYMDPPYYNNEADYGKDLFKRGDFQNLAQTLNTIKGSFIMSLNDCEATRDIFKMFHITTVKTNYTITRGKPKSVSEILISNIEF